jgi:hypothetical protein
LFTDKESCQCLCAFSCATSMVPDQRIANQGAPGVKKHCMMRMEI